MRLTERLRIRARFDNWIVEHLFPPTPFITFGSDAELGPATIRSDGEGHIIIELAAGGRIHHVHTYDASIRVRGSGSSCTNSQLTRRQHRGQTVLPFFHIPVVEDAS